MRSELFNWGFAVLEFGVPNSFEELLSLKLGLDGFCEKMLFALTLLIMGIIIKISINNKFFDSKQNFTIFTNCFIEERTNLIRILLTCFEIVQAKKICSYMVCNLNLHMDEKNSSNTTAKFMVYFYEQK